MFTNGKGPINKRLFRLFLPDLRTLYQNIPQMSNSHHEKYITKLLVGIACVTAGIFVILYAALEKEQKHDWYFWGILASIGVNAGVIMMGSAFVHKMKSDLIRRQRQKEQHKTFMAD